MRGGRNEHEAGGNHASRADDAKPTATTSSTARAITGSRSVRHVLTAVLQNIQPSPVTSATMTMKPKTSSANPCLIIFVIGTYPEL